MVLQNILVRCFYSGEFFSQQILGFNQSKIFRIGIMHGSYHTNTRFEVVHGTRKIHDGLIIPIVLHLHLQQEIRCGKPLVKILHTQHLAHGRCTSCIFVFYAALRRMTKRQDVLGRCRSKKTVNKNAPVDPFLLSVMAFENVQKIQLLRQNGFDRRGTLGQMQYFIAEW